MENFLLIFILLTFGIILKPFKLFPENAAHVLNLFVIYVSLPALVLLNIPKLSFSSELIIPVLIPWLMIIFSAVLILFLARIFKWRRSIVGGLLLVVPLGNTSFLGIPMIKAFFGQDHIPYAILYDQFGSFLALATYGSVVLALYGNGSRPGIKDIVKKVIYFPPFIALIVALLLRFWSYPPVMVGVLQMAAETLVPVVMFAVGLQISFRLPRSVVSPMIIGLLIKLILAPLAALAVCSAFGILTPPARVSVFEAGMGPMITAGALAIIAGLEPELMASMVGLGIALSFLTLPVLFQML
ncbi:MAG: AEC family transporter [Ignavibacteria bacterium]|jgi:predicted permease|nr:AEC family transporter [Ignavibacteria bacterium]MCU7504142.1 AEC family transporter [Ignavibacteria bacterium]MCU7516408.1 AEC family transporter [Ignavibacteria bacterium]